MYIDSHLSAIVLLDKIIISGNLSNKTINNIKMQSAQIKGAFGFYCGKSFCFDKKL